MSCTDGAARSTLAGKPATSSETAAHIAAGKGDMLDSKTNNTAKANARCIDHVPDQAQKGPNNDPAAVTRPEIDQPDLPWPVHPAAKLYPMLDREEHEKLVTTIRQNGLRQPVALWRDENGKVWLIDGRNRALACRDAGVEIDTVEVDGDPWEHILDANARRRHMEKGPLAAITRLVLDQRSEWQEARAARRSRKPAEVDCRSKTGHATTADDLVARTGCSSTMAAKVNALGNRSRAALEEVAAGRTSVNAAYEATKTTRTRVPNVEAWAKKVVRVVEELQDEEHQFWDDEGVDPVEGVDEDLLTRIEDGLALLWSAAKKIKEALEDEDDA